MKTKEIFISLFIFFMLPFFAMAQTQSSNTGFVDGPLWFSQDKIIIDDDIQIFTALFNGEDHKIFVEVDFFNNNVLIGSRKVSVLSNETKTVAYDWKARIGNHDFVARIAEATDLDGVIILPKTETKHTRMTVSRDINVPNIRSGIGDEINAKLNIGEDSFIFEAQSYVSKHTVALEAFRKEKLESFQAKKDVLDVKRESDKESGSSTNVLSLMHLTGLTGLVIIFSIIFVYYGLFIIFSFIILRFLWRKFRNLFRKKYDYE